MATIPVEQAIYGNPGTGGYRFLARSPGFLDDWLTEAERICTGFGERPAGVACPGSVFAQPFGLHHVAVVQVADQGADDAGRPGALAFYLVAVPRRAYVDFLGDPFVIADRCPPPWDARDTLPLLAWPAEPLPPRSVAQVQKVLQSSHSAALLGGAQALVDGSRVVFERSAPDSDLLRNLWTLLPLSTRCHVWPASFAFGNALGFDALIVPRADEMTFTSYLTEEQCGDYPEGRYELNLQIAAEAGNQPELDALFARRSSTQMFKLALMLLVAIGVIAVVMQLLSAYTWSAHGTVRTTHRTEPPLPAKYPEVTWKMRLQVADELKALMNDLGLEVPKPKPTVETLLAALDAKLGTPDPEHDCGPLKSAGSTERQLRTLLWKHHVDGFDDPKLNPSELVERLRKQLLADKPAKE